MKQKILLLFAGIGIVALIFITSALTTSSETNSDSLFEVGKTYKIMTTENYPTGGFYVTIYITELKGDWVKTVDNIYYNTNQIVKFSEI